MTRAMGIAMLGVCVITIVACTVYFERIDRAWGITQTDFSVFYFAGWRIIQHQSMYYSDNPEYLFKYAPPVGVAMMPLAKLGINVAIQWWYAITCAALLAALAGVRMLTRQRLSSGDPPLLAWALIVIAVLRPYLANLRLGQIDVLLAAILVGFLVALSYRWDALAGWWLGAAIVCKLVPAVWLLYLLATKRWRAIVWTAIAVVAYLLSPLPVLGTAGTWGALREWLVTLHTSSGNWEWLLRYKNQSVLSLVLRTLVGIDASGTPSESLPLAIAFTSGLGGWYVWIVWRALDRSLPMAGDRLVALVPASLVFIGMVIFSPHAWKATFIHLLTPYAVLVIYLFTRRPDDWIGWGTLVWSMTLVSLTAPDVVLGRSLSHTVHRFSPMMWGAVVLAWGVWRVQRPDEGSVNDGVQR